MAYKIGDKFEGARIIDVRHGGMGLVYVCDGTIGDMEGRFAVKTFAEFEEIIRGSIAGDLLESARDRLKKRFWQEALINLSLGVHPNIVTTYAVWQHNGVPFMQMEYVDGPTLRELLQGDLLAIDTVVSYQWQLVQGLKYAYEDQSLLHQDIKPENILFTPDGTLKIADFGLARNVTEELVQEAGVGTRGVVVHTSLAHVLGTLPYVSPEQALSPAKTTIQSDIYSCGVVLFEMLTKRLPFSANTVEELLGSISAKTPPRVTLYQRGVSARLEAVVARCLSKQPQDRFANYSELLEELEPLLPNRRRPVPAAAQWEGQLSRKIMGFINLGMEGEALRLLEQARSGTPLTTELLHAAGTAYGNLGKHEQALAAFDQALLNESSPLRKRTLFNKGNSLVALNRLDNAIHCNEEALELDPSYTNALLGLAQAYFKKEEFERTLYYCDRALAIDQDIPGIWSIKAISYFRQGNIDVAVQTLKTGYERCGTTPFTLKNFAVAYEGIGKSDEASRLMLEYLNTSPRLSAEAILEGLAVAVHTDKEDDFSATIRRLVTSDPENDAWESLNQRPITELRINAFLESKEFDKAEILINKELAKAPEDVGMLVAKAGLLRERGQREAALVMLDEIAHLHPGDPLIHHEMGRIYAELGRFEDALQAFNTSIESGESVLGSHIGKAQMLQKLGRFDDALKACETILALAPNKTSTIQQKGELLIELNRADEAWAWLINALSYDENSVEALTNLVLCSLKLKRYGDAVKYSDRILEIQPKNAQAWHNKGLALFLNNQQQESLVCYLKAVTLREDMYPAYTGIGLYHLVHKDYVQAIQYFDKALDISPDYAPAISNRLVAEIKQDIKIGVNNFPSMKEEEITAEIEKRLKESGNEISLDLMTIREYGSDLVLPLRRELHKDFAKLREQAAQLAETGKYDDAIYILKDVVRNVPTDRDSWYNLALYLDAAEQHAEALSCFDQALNLYPANYFPSETLNSKGEALRKLGRFEDAITLYDEVLKHEPDHELALNNKGLCLKNLNRFDEARNCYKEALAAHPDSWLVLGNLGQLEAQQGDNDAALKCCERLKGLDQKNVMVHVLLCVIYSQLDKDEDLQGELEQVRMLDPNQPILALFRAESADQDLPKFISISPTLSVSVMPSPTPTDAHNENLKRLMKKCSQRVAVFDNDKCRTEIPELEGACVSCNQLYTFRQIKTVFTLHLLHAHNDRVDLESHVTDIRPGYKVFHIVTRGKGEVGTVIMTEPIVAIIEIDGPDDLWHKTFLDNLGKIEFLGKPYLYCHSNPLLVLERLLGEGSVIEWCTVGLRYRDGEIRAEHGVLVCFYWIDDMPFPLFHISDNMLTTAISAFCDEFIADNNRIHTITAEELFTRISNDDLSRFSDHPVLLYYLCGKTAVAALSEVRR